MRSFDNKLDNELEFKNCFDEIQQVLTNYGMTIEQFQDVTALAKIEDTCDSVGDYSKVCDWWQFEI